jgi:hypothetical protein
MMRGRPSCLWNLSGVLLVQAFVVFYFFTIHATEDLICALYLQNCFQASLIHLKLFCNVQPQQANSGKLPFPVFLAQD